jgi:hypothetical protein
MILHTVLSDAFLHRLLQTRQPPQLKGAVYLDRCRHAKLLTDTGDRKLWNLPVTRYRSPAMGRRVLPDRVLCAFPYELTPMLTQMAQQVAPFHEAAVWGTTLI